MTAGEKEAMMTSVHPFISSRDRKSIFLHDAIPEGPLMSSLNGVGVSRHLVDWRWLHASHVEMASRYLFRAARLRVTQVQYRTSWPLRE